MLLEQLKSQLEGEPVSRISRQLGTDENTVKSAISTALPILVGALAKNAQDKSGRRDLARALEQDHDGSILDHLGSFLSQPEKGSGDGILRHLLGSKREPVEQAIGARNGLNPQTISQLLTLLAPIVMGQLGKAKKEKDLGSRGLRDLLQQEHHQVQEKTPGAAGLWSLLDGDGDGQVIDDVAGMLGNYFK